jgi:hypothetical protein
MSQSATQPWGILDEIYGLLIKYPQSFFAIFIVWVLMLVFFDKALDVDITPWWGLMTLIVSVGIVIGILLLAFGNNTVS